MSKAELASKAGVSPLTIDRIEKGLPCRLETKRKIILALGMDLSEKKGLLSVPKSEFLSFFDVKSHEICYSNFGILGTS